MGTRNKDQDKVVDEGMLNPTVISPQLLERLAAAERVCRLYGMSPARIGPNTAPVERATTQAWMLWSQLAPEVMAGNRTAAEDAEIEQLAAERDAIRAATLAALVEPA